MKDVCYTMGMTPEGKMPLCVSSVERFGDSPAAADEMTPDALPFFKTALMLTLFSMPKHRRPDTLWRPTQTGSPCVVQH